MARVICFAQVSFLFIVANNQRSLVSLEKLLLRHFLVIIKIFHIPCDTFFLLRMSHQMQINYFSP